MLVLLAFLFTSVLHELQLDEQTVAQPPRFYICLALQLVQTGAPEVQARLTMALGRACILYNLQPACCHSSVATRAAPALPLT